MTGIRARVADVLWPDRFAALRIRDLRVVFGAAMVSNLGDGVVGVALAFAVLDLTHSASDLGFVIASRTAAQVLALLVGGVVADRISRRRLMMIADLIRFVGQAAIGILLLSGHATVPELIASQLVLGAAGGFFDPASLGLLQAVAGEHIQEANALQGLVRSGVSIIGPILGGVLVVGLGASWALVVDAGSYALSALLLSRISRAGAAAVDRGGERSTFLSDLRGGFREVSSRTWVWGLIVTFALSNALQTTWDVFGPLICRRYYDGASTFALLSTLFAVGSVLGGTLLLRLRPRYPLRFGIFVCGFFPVPPILLALRVPLAVVLPLQVLGGMAPLTFNTLWYTALTQHVPPQVISRVVSYDMAGSFAIQPIGLALAGPLVVLVGLSPAMLVCAGGAVVLTLGSLLVRGVWSLQSTSVAEAGAE